MRWRRLALLGPLAALATSSFLAGACARRGSPDAPDTTRVARQRLAALEAERSFGDGELFAALRHRDARLRRAAVVALGRIQDAAAADSLLPLLDDADSTVVEQCAWALRQLQWLDEATRSRVESALIGQLQTQPTPRLWMYIEALRPHPSPASFAEVSNWVAGGLFAGMGSEARAPRLEGMAALTLAAMKMDRARRLLGTLGVLTNRDPEAAWRIAEAMTLEPDSSYLGSVISLGDHVDADSRAAGARALSKYDPERAAPVLYRLLSDTSWEVRASALRSLGELGQTTARSYCAAMVADRSPLVREAALAALERLGAAEHVGLAAEALQDSVPAVRLAAVRVMAKARGGAARSAFEAARRDSVDFVRSEVLAVASDVFGAAGAAKLLVGVLQDATLRERCEAAQALGALAGATLQPPTRGNVQEALQGALQDEDFVLASLAAEALGKLGVGRSAGALVQAYGSWQEGHHAADVRLAVVPALGAVAKAAPRVRDSILPCLEQARADADVRVAAEARKALAVLRGESEPAPEPPHARPGAVPAPLPAIDLGKVLVRLVTRHGETILELDGDAYPRTVGNFLALVDQGFYSDGVFHRVVPAFVVQGGCPRGDGWGGAGTFLPCEYGNLRYDSAGIVGMAHAGKDTGGSQFFITHLPVPRLDGRYTAFGRVVQGMNQADRIVRGDRFRIERVPPAPPPP